MILAIDPGTTESAWVVWTGRVIHDHGKWGNVRLLEALRNDGMFPDCHELAIEMISGYGLPVGNETFRTCVWIGHFEEAWTQSHCLRVWREIIRKDIKRELCGNTTARDTHVRQALIDRVGPQGTKKAPGPTFGLKGDEWSALAIAVVAMLGVQPRIA